MKLVIAAIIILVLAFSGYHLSFRRLTIPWSAHRFYLTGTEFLLLGLLLGPKFCNLLDPPTYSDLQPLIYLLLGWVGLLTGFQFELRVLRRLPPGHIVAGLGEGGLVWVWMFSGLCLAMAIIGRTGFASGLVMAAVLASVAACTSHTELALARQDTGPNRRRTIRLMQHMAGLDSLAALLLFSLIYAFKPFINGSPFHLLEFAIHGFWALCTGAALLMLGILFLARRPAADELALIVVGMAVMAGGAAGMLDFSPLFTCFFMGVGLVNLSREKERIYTVLAGVEKPVYLLILFFLGVGLWVDTLWLLTLAGLYCLARVPAKILGAWIMTRIHPGLRAYPAGIGMGMLDQGGLALAILLDFQQNFHPALTAEAVSLVLIALVCNTILSPYLRRQVLPEKRV